MKINRKEACIVWLTDATLRSDFAKYSILPQNGKPISKWEDTDEAWLSVVEGIAELLLR